MLKLFQSVCLSFTLLLLSTAAARDELVLIDYVVAVVEEDVIMASELIERTQMIRQRFAKRNEPMPPDELLQKQVLDHLIVERLQLQMADRRGIRIDDLTLNETMRNIAKRNNLSLENFREKLIDQGIDYVDFREQVRRELIIDSLRKRVIDEKIQITDQEVDDLIATQTDTANNDVEFRLNHILITIPEAANSEQIKESRDKAKKLRERALSGEDFRKLAVSESDGQNALEGGDLGLRKLSQLPTIFARYVARMEVGEISEVIRSPSGFHIIRLTERLGEERKLVHQTHARHILIKSSAEVDNDKARRKLNNINRRIENGESFAELAKANSDDTNSAIEGGDLGWVSPGTLVPEFEKAMDSLEIGQRSEPFRSAYGWHIVEVLERREYDSTQEVMRSQARQIIRQRKTEEETELWLRRLRDQSYVEYRLDREGQG
jgi:peptidyl-prolyl cis-trans isomerase SurA